MGTERAPQKPAATPCGKRSFHGRHTLDGGAEESVGDSLWRTPSEKVKPLRCSHNLLVTVLLGIEV